MKNYTVQKYDLDDANIIEVICGEMDIGMIIDALNLDEINYCSEDERKEIYNRTVNLRSIYYAYKYHSGRNYDMLTMRKTIEMMRDSLLIKVDKLGGMSVVHNLIDNTIRIRKIDEKCSSRELDAFLDSFRLTQEG